LLERERVAAGVSVGDGDCEGTVEREGDGDARTLGGNATPLHTLRGEGG
jgi:hypothetical protein